MAAGLLNPDARKENIRALAAAAGLTEEAAAARLDEEVLLTWDEGDPLMCALVNQLLPILNRTLIVNLEHPVGCTKSYSAEVVIGQRAPMTSAPRIFVALHSDRLVISKNLIQHSAGQSVHDLLVLISACYIAGAAIRCAVGHDMPNPPPDTFKILFADLVDPEIDLSAPVDIDEAYLAGAGAIGNGFIWAAQHVHFRGKLHVTDDDTVSTGNLQRQVWFNEDDIGDDKVEILCRKAQPFMPDLQLVPSVSRLQDHANKVEGPWLKRLIVGVDSRGARRQLQKELPGEVFDASTTGSREIVLHYNKQPNNSACLACIYYQDQKEISHEQFLADHLGIAVSDLQKGHIDDSLAAKICQTHTKLDPKIIRGMAFDSLYKELCSSGQLKAANGEQVIAPFAFISVLAGALLVLEVIKRLSQPLTDYPHDWRVNPWREPFPDMWQTRPRRENCECCGRVAIQKANAALWGDGDV